MRTERAIFTAAALLLASLAACSGEPGTAQHDHERSAGSHTEAGPAAHAGAGHTEHETAEHTGSAHQAASAEAVHLTPAQRDMLDIGIGEAGAGVADGQIEAAATVHFDPDLVAEVGPRLPANVVEVLVDLGDRVEAGQALVRLDSTELGQARADHLVSAARLSAARLRLEREESLAEQQISSEAERIEARSAFEQARAMHEAASETLRLYGLRMQDIERHEPTGEEPLSRYTLRAPRGGTVQRRDLVQGERLMPDDAPLEIVDTGQVWLVIEAFEQSLSRLREGLPVRFRTLALPDRSFSGQIDWISARLDESNRTLHVRARLDNGKGLLRAGMAGTAVIEAGDTASRTALVPIDAVQRLGEQDIVFVPGHEEGAYEVRHVVTGTEGNGMVGIREGLAPGDELVVRGAFDLMSTLTAGSRSAAHSH